MKYWKKFNEKNKNKLKKIIDGGYTNAVENNSSFKRAEFLINAMAPGRNK